MTLPERALRGIAALRTLAAQPPADRPVFARAWWALLACRLRLRFPRLLGARSLIVEELHRDGGDSPGPLDDRLFSLFNRAVRDHILAMPCLPRALALARYLRRHGVEGRLRVGMKKGDEGLRGHAWVESAGQPVNDPSELASSFVPFQSAGVEA